MATYFHGNSDPSDHGLQTLVLMNHGYVHYNPDNNLVFLNSVVQTLPPPHAPPSHTLQFPSSSQSMQTANHHEAISTLDGVTPHVQYNLWNPVDTAAHDTTTSPHGLQHGVLSLSLSSQTKQAISGDDMININSAGSGSAVSGVSNGGRGAMQGVLLSSKYLRAAQELLVEVVGVGNYHDEIKKEFEKKSNRKESKLIGQASVGAFGDGGIGSDGGKNCEETPAAERREIQMKRAKLITMLDEVEHRYKQYNHQMQIIILAFEQVSGTGSSRTYTSLALQTISKQFRSLKDTIVGQIRVVNKRLGSEEEGVGAGNMEGTRLKYVDHHLRQQQAFQQLGTIRHNAWRPQRGLPERSVSVLRAWLFEHFLHPYPKDSDKHMLAKQSGLTRSQVSNWFINARVRLWKPMVEEMYLEEIKEQEKNGSSSAAENLMNKNYDEEGHSASMSTGSQVKESPATHENQPTSFINFKQENNSTNQNLHPEISIPSERGNFKNQSGFTLIESSELEGITQPSPKKQRGSKIISPNSTFPSINTDENISMNFSHEDKQNRDGYSFIGSQNNLIAGFGQYPIGEIERFDAEQFTTRFSAANGVSLTLGLPHCENLSLSATHQTFLPNQNINHLGGRRVNMGETNEFGTITTSTQLDNINIQNQKRFVAHLLPDCHMMI